jgi:hypothetical protein
VPTGIITAPVVLNVAVPVNVGEAADAAPRAVRESAALRALIVLSALMRMKRIASGLARVKKLAPTVVPPKLVSIAPVVASSKIVFAAAVTVKVANVFAPVRSKAPVLVRAAMAVKSASKG